MPEIAIEMIGLTKVFRGGRETRSGFGGTVLNKLRPARKDIVAVDKVDLKIRQGELFGLLGPNGAGKTTLIKMLCTLLIPTSGSAKVAGFDIVKQSHQVRRSIGVVLGGERALYWRLTGRENLWFFSQLYNIPGAESKRRISELLDLVGLTDRADERVEAYSKGMKQRLHIARGLINDPMILLLDEPTIGLDPQAARDLRHLVQDICRKEGKTILLTTHYMYEADELSQRVAIIDHGQIITQGSPSELKSKFSKPNVLRLEVQHPSAILRSSLEKSPSIERVVETRYDEELGVATLRLFSSSIESTTKEVPELVAAAGARLISLSIETPSLEDVFIELTGRTITSEESAVTPVEFHA